MYLPVAPSLGLLLFKLGRCPQDRILYTIRLMLGHCIALPSRRCPDMGGSVRICELTSVSENQGGDISGWEYRRCREMGGMEAQWELYRRRETQDGRTREMVRIVLWDCTPSWGGLEDLWNLIGGPLKKCWDTCLCIKLFERGGRYLVISHKCPVNLGTKASYALSSWNLSWHYRQDLSLCQVSRIPSNLPSLRLPTWLQSESRQYDNKYIYPDYRYRQI